jgi:hypothetical protein
MATWKDKTGRWRRAPISEPTVESEPKRIRGPVWPWLLLIFYVAGVAACIAYRGTNCFGLIEAFSCVLFTPLAIIGGILYGTQDKDPWMWG